MHTQACCGGVHIIFAIKSPQILAGKYAKDFGVGFYCTVLREQAVRWASRYSSPTLNVYEYEKNPSLKIRDFAEMTEEWLDFVVFCRSGKKHDYENPGYIFACYQEGRVL